MSVSTSCPALSWGHRAAVELCLGQTCLRGQVALVAFALSRFLQAQACGGSCSHGGRSWCPEKAGLRGLLVEGVHRRGGCSQRGWAGTWEHAFLMPRPHVAFTRVSGTLPRCRPLSAPFRSPSRSQGHFKLTGVCLHLAWLFTKCVPTSLGGHVASPSLSTCISSAELGKQLASLLGAEHTPSLSPGRAGALGRRRKLWGLLRAEGSRHTQKRQFTFV